MSPSRFVGEFGGELDRISRCFRELAEWGYLELAEEVVGEGRRGGVEHVYRLVRRGPPLGGHGWNHLSPETGEALSEPVVKAFHARVEEGVKAGIFDREIDSHLALDAALFDRAAWSRIMRRLRDVMSSLPGREAAAARRLEENDGEVIPATVALAGFRSPEAPALAMKPPFWIPPTQGREKEEAFAVSVQLAHALRNPLRSHILLELTLEPLSAPRFARKFGWSLSTARRQFSLLAEWGLIDLVEERKGRNGSPEKVYRAKYRLDLDEAEFEDAPLFVREEASAPVLRSFWCRVYEAIRAGTFDQKADRYFDWNRCVLDRPGWRALMAELGDCLSWIFELEREAADRLDRSGEVPIPTTYFLAGFRAPDPTSQT